MGCMKHSPLAALSQILVRKRRDTQFSSSGSMSSRSRRSANTPSVRLLRCAIKSSKSRITAGSVTSISSAGSGSPRLLVVASLSLRSAPSTNKQRQTHAKVMVVSTPDVGCECVVCTHATTPKVITTVLPPKPHSPPPPKTHDKQHRKPVPKWWSTSTAAWCPCTVLVCSLERGVCDRSTMPIELIKGRVRRRGEVI